jgi:cobyric acid synthase
MKQVNRNEIENFLRNEGYEISTGICSDEEKKIFECWIKQGLAKVRVRKGKNIFQQSELSSIFQNNQLLKRFTSKL